MNPSVREDERDKRLKETRADEERTGAQSVILHHPSSLSSVHMLLEETTPPTHTRRGADVYRDRHKKELKEGWMNDSDHCSKDCRIFYSLRPPKDSCSSTPPSLFNSYSIFPFASLRRSERSFNTSSRTLSARCVRRSHHFLSCSACRLLVPAAPWSVFTKLTN